MTVSQNESFFDINDRPWDSLLALQTDPSAPQAAGSETGTGLVLPDRSVLSRMRHFPEPLYDLSDTSHLMRFCQALMGESGSGGLRKRNTVVQFQATMQGTNFYDLDRFYGAIFGIYRFASEVLRLNPYVDTATQVEWDEVEDADASFRDRIFRLAAAINLGATYPGIKAAAEALTLVDCEVYESWSLIDLYGSGEVGNTWDDVEGLGTWDDIEAMDADPLRPTWSDITDEITVGRTGTNTRSEVTVWPKKDYSTIASQDGDEEAERQRAQDEEALVRVLSVLKPAGVLLTVDNSGVSPHDEVSIAHMWSPSSFWEVAEIITPGPDYDSDVYPLSPSQIADGVEVHDPREIPKPPWTTNQRVEWTYNSDVVSAQSYAVDPAADQTLPGEGNVIETNVNHSVAREDGSLNVFSAKRGILDGRKAHAARLGKEGVLSVHPYAGDRVEAVPHG